MKILLFNLLTLLLPSLGSWDIKYDSLGITNLVSTQDVYNANLLGEGRLGDVVVTYKVKEGLWQTLPRGNRLMNVSNDVLTYTDRGMGDAMVVTQTFRQERETLHWGIVLENRSSFPVEIGDLAVTIPWKGNSGEEPKEIFERSFII